jgi:uncharacterized protein YfiM (DUF2279 family)
MSEFDMSQPELMARQISRQLRETGMAYAEAKRIADDAKNHAKLETKLVAIAVRKGKIDIGEKATEQAVKDFVATCPQVAKAEMEEEDAVYKAHKAEIAYECTKADKDLLKGLLFHSGRMEG